MSPEREDLRPYVGPTPYCNWVIKDRVMAGGYPACLDDEENDELLTVLLRDLGIDTFVCLQSEVWPDVPDAAWRPQRQAGTAFTDGTPRNNMITSVRVTFALIA